MHVMRFASARPLQVLRAALMLGTVLGAGSVMFDIEQAHARNVRPVGQILPTDPDNDNDACPGPFCDTSEAAELGLSNSNASSTQQQQINAATAAAVTNAGVVATQTAIRGVQDHIDGLRTQQAVRQISGATGGTSPGAETGGAGGGGSNLALGPSSGVPTSGTGAATGGGGGGGVAVGAEAAEVAEVAAVLPRVAAEVAAAVEAAHVRKPPRRMEAVAVAAESAERSERQGRGAP